MQGSEVRKESNKKGSSVITFPVPLKIEKENITINTINPLNLVIDNIIKLSTTPRNFRLEVTPTIGCPCRCDYCPQEKLQKKYRKEDEYSTEKPLIHMNPLDFEKILNNCPPSNQLRIHWTGYVEPLISPNISELLKICIKRGIPQMLNTTLLGAKKSYIDLLESGLVSINLHLPDDENMMKVNVNKDYLDIMEYTISKLNVNTDTIHFIGTPHRKIIKSFRESRIIRDKIRNGLSVGTIETISRASNLIDHKNVPEVLNFSKMKMKKKGLITAYCSKKRFSQPVLLPDGRVTLCCMDYGLEEVLGNLLNTKLEQILELGNKRMASKIALGEDNLCSKCEWLEWVN